MPPWPASTTEGGPFRTPGVLTDDEIDTLAAWAEAGCPEGDQKTHPPRKPGPRTGRSASLTWFSRSPEAVYASSADGRDEYRVFVIPTHLIEGKWISAIDFKPGNAEGRPPRPGGLRHGRPGTESLTQKTPQPGYKVFGGFGVIPSGGLGGWAPGSVRSTLPMASAVTCRPVPMFSCRSITTRTARPRPTRRKIALYFSKTPVDKMVARRHGAPPRVRTLLARHCGSRRVSRIMK